MLFLLTHPLRKVVHCSCQQIPGPCPVLQRSQARDSQWSLCHTMLAYMQGGPGSIWESHQSPSLQTTIYARPALTRLQRHPHRPLPSPALRVPAAPRSGQTGARSVGMRPMWIFR